jgi:uncharacterized protein
VVRSGSVDDCEGFEWDEGNVGKSWPKHRITDWECEEVFFNRPLVVRADLEHSAHEDYALGQTGRGKLLFVAFTIRARLIRPISFREMNARERRIYENAKKDTDIQG